MDPGTYSRELEAYLCRKNDGHLVRIAGPAFEKVCGWAEQGIPFKIACRGIDRYFERYYSKGPRRRPVRIEFCEADILDVFEEWRRAVGVGTGQPGSEATRDASRPSLPAHLQRIMQKLSSARASAGEPIAAVLDRSLDAIEEVRTRAGSLRGTARAQALEQLEQIDREMMDGVRAALSRDVLAELGRDAREELAGFAPRMSAGSFDQALAGATERLIRERFGLPRVVYGG
jgi:hypothetical protein